MKFPPQAVMRGSSPARGVPPCSALPIGWIGFALGQENRIWFTMLSRYSWRPEAGVFGAFISAA